MLRRIAPRPLLLAVAVALLAAGCGDAVSPGLRVGDRTVAHATLLDEMDEWAANPALAQQFGSTFGPARASFSTELAAAVVRFRIQRELVGAEADRRAITPSAGQREQARDVLYGDPQTADAIEAGFSSGYAAELLDDTALEVALSEELGEQAYIQWVDEALRATRIEVSSRFGRWDPELQQVFPPEGPTTTTTAPTAPPIPEADPGLETVP